MPGLRENLTERLSWELQIDDEFAALIPPLTADELSRLEQSIIKEGCREAIITWNNIIVDGHNRYRICKAHNIPYQTVSMSFEDRNAVMLWMLQNQLARRNLNDFQRVELVRKCEDAIKARARERQGTRTDLMPSAEQQLSLTEEDNIVEKLPQGSKSRDELGAIAGVSGKTYEHATAILDTAPAPVVDATRRKELSINAAYQVTKLPPEQQQEVAERISQGEQPRKVVAEVRKNVSASEPIPKTEPAIETEQVDTQEAGYSLCIPFIDAFIKNGCSPVDGVTVNKFLLHAYEHSKEFRFNRLDIYEGNLQPDDVEDIAALLKQHDIHEFTLSADGGKLLQCLADFQAHGFYVHEMVALKYNNMGHDTIPAILLRDTSRS
ncbi:MAG: hypothetical protein IJS28_07240 [Synergistaceae bacterium]|nr:hypothetical protein [Synergistaceae bacterium]